MSDQYRINEAKEQLKKFLRDKLKDLPIDMEEFDGLSEEIRTKTREIEAEDEEDAKYIVIAQRITTDSIIVSAKNPHAAQLKATELAFQDQKSHHILDHNETKTILSIYDLSAAALVGRDTQPISVGIMNTETGEVVDMRPITLEKGDVIHNDLSEKEILHYSKKIRDTLRYHQEIDVMGESPGPAEDKGILGQYDDTDDSEPEFF